MCTTLLQCNPGQQDAFAWLSIKSGCHCRLDLRWRCQACHTRVHSKCDMSACRCRCAGSQPVAYQMKWPTSAKRGCWPRRCWRPTTAPTASGARRSPGGSIMVTTWQWQHQVYAAVLAVGFLWLQHDSCSIRCTPRSWRLHCYNYNLNIITNENISGTWRQILAKNITVFPDYIVTVNGMNRLFTIESIFNLLSTNQTNWI